MGHVEEEMKLSQEEVPHQLRSRARAYTSADRSREIDELESINPTLLAG